MDDITAFMNGRNKELVEMTEKVLKKGRERGGGEGLEAIAVGGKQGKSKAITFWKYLEERFRFSTAARKKELCWRRVLKRWEETCERSSWR